MKLAFFCPAVLVTALMGRNSTHIYSTPMPYKGKKLVTEHKCDSDGLLFKFGAFDIVFELSIGNFSFLYIHRVIFTTYEYTNKYIWSNVIFNLNLFE